MAKFHSIPTKRLEESITKTDSSFSIRDALDWNGDTLDPADFDAIEYGVFRNETNTQVEFFSFDASDIDNRNITILKRGLEYDGDLTTENGDYKRNWIKGETLVELGADPGQLFQWLKDYIDDAIVAGASNATTSVKGIIEIATDAEIAAGTTNGSTGARLVIPVDSPYVEKLVKKRVSEEASSATPTIDTDDVDVHKITALATNITDMSANLSGTPTDWQILVIEITGTATRSINWGTSFANGGVYNLPSATDGTTPLKCIFQWNGTDWVIIGIA